MNTSLLKLGMLLAGMLCISSWGQTAGLAEGEYKELMYRGFQSSRLQKSVEIHDSGFDIKSDMGVVTYQYVPPVDARKGVFAVVCSRQMNADVLAQWRQTCRERAMELVLRKWLERICNQLAEEVENRLADAFPPPEDCPPGKSRESVLAIQGYPTEYLIQSFSRFDLGCLCLGKDKGVFSSDDCEVKLDNGKTAHFFFAQFQIVGESESSAVVRELYEQDRKQIALALYGSLARRLVSTVRQEPWEKWSKEEMDEMRRVLVMLYALDPAAREWASFGDPSHAPKILEDKRVWSDLLKYLFA